MNKPKTLEESIIYEQHCTESTGKETLLKSEQMHNPNEIKECIKNVKWEYVEGTKDGP